MNGGIFTVGFWKATAERAISTGAQMVLWSWGAGTLPDVSLPWWTLPVAFLAGVALTTIKAVAANAATGDGPGATGAEVVREDD